MKKNSIDKLLTLNFGRMCAANFSLFASVYLILPLLLSWVSAQLGKQPAEGAYLYLMFALGMLAIGPFHAYLGDTYKRQRVLEVSLVLMGLATLGYGWATRWSEFLALAALHGCGFGGATAASITIGIDITASTRRGEGNKIFTFLGRVGMLAGLAAAYGLAANYDFKTLSYLSAGGLLVAFYLGSRVYVPFRAPIGLPVCSLDRFLLPRAWVPALHVALLSVLPGLWWATAVAAHSWTALVGFGVLALLSWPLTHGFVQLSQHCQRGTANLTYQLATELGVLGGWFGATRLDAVTEITWPLAVVVVLGLLLVSFPYYRHMKVR